MNGIEDCTHSARMVYPNPSAPPFPGTLGQGALRRNTVSRSGFMASAKRILSQALSTGGFVDPSAGARANFNMLVTDQPDESVDMEDLKPGLVTEVAAWVASELEARPDRVQRMQARIDPQRAVCLLRT